MGFDSDWNNGANGSGDTCSNHVRDLRIQWAGMAGHGLYLGKTDNDQFTGVNIATVGKINISAFTITNNVGSITTATPHWIAPGRSDGIFLTSLRNRRLETGYLATAVDSTHLTITIPTSLFNIPGGGASYTCPFGSGDECASTTSGLHPVGLYASDLPNGRVDSHLINQMNNTSGMVWNPIDPLSRVGGVTITDYLAEQRDSLENLGKLLVNGANGARMVNPIPIYTSKLTFINNGQNDNIDIGDSVFLVFTGLTNVGSITGFTNGYDGRLLMVFFSNNQQVTLRNQAGSTSGNQIFTNTLADVTLRTGPSSATFMYSAVMNSWVLMSYN